MAKDAGYIKISRRLLEWEHSGNMALVGFWVYLLLRVNYEDRRTLKRGQCLTTYDALSEDTGLSRATIARYLKQLKDSGEIQTERVGNKTKISISKWDSYQRMYKFETTRETTRETTCETTSGNSHPYLIKDKKEKERKNASVTNNDAIDLEHFEEFRSQFPKRDTRQRSLDAYQKALNAGATEEILMRKLTEWKEKQWSQWPEQDKRYVPGIVKWLETEKWAETVPEYRQRSETSLPEWYTAKPIREEQKPATEEEIRKAKEILTKKGKRNEKNIL